MEPPYPIPPTPPLDDASEIGPEKSPPLPKSTSGSPRWSAVWQYFCLSPLDSCKAVRIHCLSESGRGKSRKDLGSSFLLNVAQVPRPRPPTLPTPSFPHSPTPSQSSSPDQLTEQLQAPLKPGLSDGRCVSVVAL